MKQLYSILLFVLCTLSLCVSPASLQANNYLEVQDHYSVYATGRDAIHVKVPLWAYGRVNNYYIANNSYLYFQESGSDEVWFAVWFKADREGDNLKADGKGSGQIFITPGRGNVVITNTYDGTRQQVNEGEGWKPFIVKQGSVNDCSQLTTLEFDWYPPESVNGKNFKIGMHLEINKYSSGEIAYKKDFLFPTLFTGGENQQAPQLYTPYLYVINEEGAAGYGLAAIPYVSFLTPVSYTMSYEPDKTIRTSSRSGSIYVSTQDTVQKNISAEFTVYRDESLGTLTTLTTPSIEVPAYHRIYDVETIEQKDESGSLTGANIIRWSIRHPAEKDLVDGDYFEIQRAYESDYSDAQTLEVLAMRNGISEYSYTDDARVKWSERNMVSDTIRANYSVTEPNYVLRNSAGEPLYEMRVRLTADKCLMPSQPVYYRIRRASSAAWGWDHEFVKTTEVYRHNYLAPLAEQQADYTLDPDFQNNRTVHFNIKIDNADITYMPPAIEDCRLDYSFIKCLSDTAVMNVRISDTLAHSVKSIAFRICKGREHTDTPLSAGNNTVKLPLSGEYTEFTFYVEPKPNTAFRGETGPATHKFWYLDKNNFEWYNGCTFDMSIEYMYEYSSGLKDYEWKISHIAGKSSATAEVQQCWEQVENTVKQELYTRLFGATNAPVFGKCIWDRTAKLVVTRTHVETGEKTNIIVPQDSIRRQADGSWLAHITDVAATPCTHYLYDVRIDQSDAELHVNDSMHLQPKNIHGPELYFNEAAHILSFDATQGATEGEQVNCVRLTWLPTSSAVDDYVLCRVEKNSDRVPDTLTVTTENTFTDTEAAPGVHYEYTLTTRYTCNGFMTANTATTEGWRSPYGRISGHVLLADQSGQKGITVTLSQGGSTIAQVITNTAGEYVFDKVEYDIASGSSFVITPTAQYGSFTYNGTSSGAAVVTLSKANALLTDIDFVNSLAHRLTGRVLYKNSTIPVADALFLLKGDTLCRHGQPIKTENDGSFELLLPQQPLSLQIIKRGHVFESDGRLSVDGSETFTPIKAIDGVRFYDETKVRLIGRVAGGIDQQALPHGFGLGKNNLGDDLQLVLMLEGDNTAHIVHDPDDLTRDTALQTIGNTRTLFEQKRITIRPDVATGEYAVDLYPVKYKVVQATAKGYATLFPAGTGSETFDLTNAPLQQQMDTLGNDTVYYHHIYDRIYRTPVQVKMTQVRYGVPCAGLGEASMQTASMNGQGDIIPLYTQASDGSVDYLLGYPVFLSERQYQFTVSAFEDYRYNNAASGLLDRVPQRSGTIRIVNDMESTTASRTYPLDQNGENKNVLLSVKNLDINNIGTAALRTVTAALEVENSKVETDVFSAFVSGNRIVPADLRSTEADLVLLDIVRDPGGTGSSAWLESGTTYKYAYTDSYAWEFGATVSISYGLNVTQDIGIVTAPLGGGSYIGSTYNTSKQLTFPLPLVHSWKWGYKYNYEFSTTDRISTSGSYSQVGANADVFLGATTSVLSGKIKTVSLINDSLWQARQPAVRAGTLKLVAQGTGADGQPYYLVIGQQVVMGSRIANTFVYTQTYILNTVIPELAQERQSKLELFANREAAQAAADARDEAVYWDLSDDANAHLRDTISKAHYAVIIPQNTNKVFTDEIAALNNIIAKWLTILYQNEKEKVIARMSGQHVGTWSVSGGTSLTHSDNYSANANYNAMPQGGDLWKYEAKYAFVEAGDKLAKQWSDMLTYWNERNQGTLGKSITQVVSQYFDAVATNEYGVENVKTQQKPTTELGTFTNTSKWSYNIEPVVSFNSDDNLSKDKSTSRKTGFTISPDTHGDITVSVYRANQDSLWQATTESIRDNADASGDDILYGSYVFFTEGGTTYCPHEPEERTNFYNKGTLLNVDTRYAAKPQMTLDTYTKVNIPSENAAVFQLTLMNNSEEETSKAADGEFMTLSLAGGNPNGAIVTVDGLNIAAGYPLYIKNGEPVIKTLEVRRGTVDDYENIELLLALDDCPKVFTTLRLSVHFLPVATDVRISAPQDNWVMNTLSPHDSIGFYLPVQIDGFDANHFNFHHIEFQYKLANNNDNEWVNQCSFFADDSLFNIATGNKQRIQNGQITNVRFYGEKDPKELNYNLRAVAFCRHGSGFVSKASNVISGTKDTRPPVLFGKPQPANGILTNQQNICLQFSEPIAGNWLDQDNNFQILANNNTNNFTLSNALYFDGKNGHKAQTKTLRELSITSLTLDMLVKPAETGRDMILFAHGNEDYSFVFSLTADNRLKLSAESDGYVEEHISKPMETLPVNDYTRLIMVYDFDRSSVRFYAGTQDLTDKAGTSWVLQNDAAPLLIGCGLNGENPFHGSMMEVRVWTKPLTPAEIANTHHRRLTGYEHGLMAYYPLSESEGDVMNDLASGATLYAQGLSWTTPQGMSLATNGSKVFLQPTLFARTEAEDYTFMCWFRSDNAVSDTVSLLATALGDSVTMQIALQNGTIRYTAGDVDEEAVAALSDGKWHHCVLVVSKTYNAGSLYVDGELLLMFPAIGTGAFAGTSVWMAGGLKGNIDDVCFFEQALPAELVREYGKQTPNGEEMGLINLLTFSAVKRNAFNSMEQVFSTDNRRVFKDANGNVVSKAQPLLVDDLSQQADKNNYAPVHDRGQLTNLPFNWTYRDSELLINIKAQTKEINKRTIYLTVRDVEDLNGNRLPSPVMWTVYANLNSITWNQRSVQIVTDYQQLSSVRYQLPVVNRTGMTRQYLIDHLPYWLNVSPQQGTLEAEEEKTITLTVKQGLKPGVHNHVIFLTDDQGLSEPLLVEVEVTTQCPYNEPQTGKYPYNMSLCGIVKNGNVVDSDPNDKVIALYNNNCVGMANVNFDNITNKSRVFLTIHGDFIMNRKQIHFRLWQASTGKMFNLVPDKEILFAHGHVYGCEDGNPVVLTAGGGETQNISLHAGWNWISTCLDLSATGGDVNTCVTASSPWSNADLIKSPETRRFCNYDAASDLFTGTLTNFHFSQMYMLYTAQENIMQISGERLAADSMSVRVRGDGQWSVMPCLFDEPVSVTKAFADYYDYAVQGDLIKGHNSFAYFSEDKKWEGDLTVLRPGEGYLFRRIASGSKDIKFYRQSTSSAPQRVWSGTSDTRSAFSNPYASANMTMIVRIEGLDAGTQRLDVYVDNELSASATPLLIDNEPLYFLTIQSDKRGAIRFETEGVALTPEEGNIFYSADSHAGSLKAPVRLHVQEDNRPYKIIENDHVVIIRNNEKYDVTGKEL